MTTQKLSSEKLLDKALFQNMTRRRLPHILVAFLANFFTVAVPLMMMLNYQKGYYDNRLIYYTYEDYVKKVAENVEELLPINLVFIFLLGIYFGIITMGYMMKRRSAHFYHALPQKRETLYTTSIASALFCALIGAMINLCIVLIEFGVYSVFVPEVLGAFFTLATKNILYFLLTYAITVFVGSFSGNGLVQMLMTLVVFFYPVLTYFAVLVLRGWTSTYFDIEYFIADGVLPWFSPVLYACWHYQDPFAFLPTVIGILLIAACLLGGMAIYRKRSIENSESPILFQKLGTVLKFMFMFTVTVFAGAFFFVIQGMLSYAIFGFVCGAVLSFMLFNTILAKSPKAMFKGLKGLIIFAVAFAISFVVLGLDVFRMDDYIPDAENISYATIEVFGAEYDDTRFDDPEMLSALSAMLKNQNQEDKKNIVYPESRHAFTVSTVIYTKLGIPIARVYSVSPYTEGAEEFLKLYVDDPRMHEEFITMMGYIEDLIEKDYTAELDISPSVKYSSENPVYDVAEFYRVYKEEFGTANYERISKPVAAAVEIRDIIDPATEERYYNLYNLYHYDGNIFDRLPVYADMTKTIEYLRLPKVDGTVYDSESNPLEISAAYIYDTRELVIKNDSTYYYPEELSVYPRVEITPELADTLRNMLLPYQNHTPYNLRAFRAIDTEYVLCVCYGEQTDEINIIDDSSLRYDVEVYSYDKEYYENVYIYKFPKGYVPAEVKALFE